MQKILQNKLSCTENVVAYFDFDGTLTRCDTFVPFLLFAFGWVHFVFKLPLLLVVLILYGLKIINNEKAKQYTLWIMARGRGFSQLDNKAREFALYKLDRYIKPEIYHKLEYHIEHKHSIILVSANLALYLNYWARRHNINGVIATEIEFIADICTGRLKTRNCYAMQKVERIKDYLKQDGLSFNYSFGYGNSRGDHELLDFVNEAYWVNGLKITSWNEYCGK